MCGAGRLVRQGASLKASRSRRAVALMASFVVSGLLHEAILGCAASLMGTLLSPAACMFSRCADAGELLRTSLPPHASCQAACGA